MNEFYDVVAVSCYNDILEQVSKNEGVKIKGVEMTRQITPIKDLKSLWEMFRFLQEEKPFIVHTHTPKAGIVGMIAAWFSGKSLLTERDIRKKGSGKLTICIMYAIIQRLT